MDSGMESSYGSSDGEEPGGPIVGYCSSSSSDEEHEPCVLCATRDWEKVNACEDGCLVCAPCEVAWKRGDMVCMCEQYVDTCIFCEDRGAVKADSPGFREVFPQVYIRDDKIEASCSQCWLVHFKHSPGFLQCPGCWQWRTSKRCDCGHRPRKRKTIFK